MNKKVKFKINLFHLLDDLDGWNYFDEMIEDEYGISHNGGYHLLSKLENDELEWETITDEMRDEK